MTSTSQQPDSPLPEELVAYLDGELPPEDCRAVEDRLANDEEYRQQLRDLDQAWEALDSLPAATVDDGFAKTTIELACVAAQEDLSQRKSLAAVETRSQRRWWIASGVAAALMAFIMVRALMAFRANAQLADLPIITQANTLAHVPDIDFLRKLSNTVPADEFINDRAAFEENVSNFTKANAPTRAERRTWVNSLTSDKKAELANGARAFSDLRSNPEEQVRIRQLANDISHANDADKLQSTLIAYGQWLSNRHSAAEREKLRVDLAPLSNDERVKRIRTMVESDNDRVERHLSNNDAAAFKQAILESAKRMQKRLLDRIPPGKERERIAEMDVTNPGPAIVILRLAIWYNEYDETATDEVIAQLSPDVQEHWRRIGRNRGKRWAQLALWFHDALKPTQEPDLEQFFADEKNEKLSFGEREKLLDLPNPQMHSELEKLYLGSELGIDNRLQYFRGFGEVRGPREFFNGPGEPGRPRERGPDFRPDGPPRGGGVGPPGTPPEFDRDGRPFPPERTRGPRGDDRHEGRRPDGPRRGPNDGPLPGPPGQPPPPPPPQDRLQNQEAA